MLKNPIICFGIKTTTDECSGPVLRELFDTLKDAMKNTTRFSDAYCPPGYCTIDRLVIDGKGPNGMHATERWTIRDGGVDKRELIEEEDNEEYAVSTGRTYTSIFRLGENTKR